MPRQTFNANGRMVDLISFEGKDHQDHVDYLLKRLADSVGYARTLAVDSAASVEEVRDAKNNLLASLREIRCGLAGTGQLGPPCCRDCGEQEPVFFMVKDEIWLEAAEKRMYLCLTCFENRLGRRVRPDDLKEGYFKRWFEMCKYILEGGRSGG